MDEKELFELIAKHPNMFSNVSIRMPEPERELTLEERVRKLEQEYHHVHDYKHSGNTW